MKDIQLSKHLTSSSALTLSHSNKLDDLRLTEHLKLSEFTRSSTAKNLGIPNVLDLEQVSNLQYLCREILEPLREWMNEPITISSGFRCPKLNKAVGGVSNSQHMTGEAADIHLPSIEKGKKYLEFIIENCRFHQVIWEHDKSGTYWIHFAIRQNAPNKQQNIPNLLKA